MVLVIGKGDLDHEQWAGDICVSACSAEVLGEKIKSVGDLEGAIAEYSVVLIHWSHDDELAPEGIPSLSAAIARFGRSRVGFLSTGGERRRTTKGEFPFLGRIFNVHALVRLIQRADLSTFVVRPTADHLIAALASVVEPPTEQAAAIGVLLQVMWGIVVADSQHSPNSEVAQEVANCAATLAALGFDPLPEHLPVATATDRATVATQFIAAVSELARSANSLAIPRAHLSTLRTNARHDLASPSAGAVRRLKLATDEFRTLYHALIG